MWACRRGAKYDVSRRLHRAATHAAAEAHSVRRTFLTLVRMSRFTFLALVAAAIGRASAQAAAPIPAQFVGTWRLVSWPQRLSDGTTRHDPRTVAYIMYSEAGYMCSMGMAPTRSKWKSQAPTGAEALAAMAGDSLYAYCARVEVHQDDGYVLHFVEIDKSPNQVGRVRKRWFTFITPDRISLRIDPSELSAPVVESTLIWERVKPPSANR